MRAPRAASALRSGAAATAAVAVQTALWLSDDHAVSAPIALAQAAIVLMPGPTATLVVGLLHEWAMRLAIAGGFAAIIVSSALAGALGRPAVALAVWAIGPVAAFLVPSLSADIRATIVSAVLAAATWGLIALAPRTRAASSSRRRVLVSAAALAVLSAAAVAGLRVARAATTTALAGAPLPALPGLRTAQVETATDPAAVAASAVPDLTPNASFYVVDEAVVDPIVAPAAWRLEIRGSVRAPFAVTYDELLALSAVEQYQTLECISNEVGGDLIGNTTWIGVPVGALLERAGVAAATQKVIFRSVDGYSSAIPLELALAPTTLVAYGMSGAALPREHGFPARLLIPGRYGMKNVKWLGAIEATTDDHLGFWERRGWDDEALVQTMSRIDRPVGQIALRANEPTIIAGVAYAGARGVARVEVSADGGATWHDAILGRRDAKASWRRWAYPWTPPSVGWHRLAVRAYDDAGVRQQVTERPPLPSGATGMHSFQIEAR